jgi:hypothetical protein
MLSVCLAAKAGAKCARCPITVPFQAKSQDRQKRCIAKIQTIFANSWLFLYCKMQERLLGYAEYFYRQHTRVTGLGSKKSICIPCPSPIYIVE